MKHDQLGTFPKGLERGTGRVGKGDWKAWKGGLEGLERGTGRLGKGD